MNDNLTLPTDLGQALRTHRKALRLSVTEVALRSGRVRDVIYRLERGEDTTVSSLMAVLSALGLSLSLNKAGLPTLEDMRARFAEDDDAA